MNYYREVKEEKISDEEAIAIGKNFLSQRGYLNMKETYYMKQSGNIVINYAYTEDKNVTVYSDLIKVKVALDNRRNSRNGIGRIFKLPSEKSDTKSAD